MKLFNLHPFLFGGHNPRTNTKDGNKSNVYQEQAFALLAALFSGKYVDSL